MLQKSLSQLWQIKSMQLNFSTEEVPLQKKTAAGTRALKLEEGEEVVFADSFDAKEKVFCRSSGKKNWTKQAYKEEKRCQAWTGKVSSRWLCIAGQHQKGEIHGAQKTRVWGNPSDGRISKTQGKRNKTSPPQQAYDKNCVSYCSDLGTYCSGSGCFSCDKWIWHLWRQKASLSSAEETKDAIEQNEQQTLAEQNLKQTIESESKKEVAESEETPLEEKQRMPQRLLRQKKQ